MEDTAGQLLCMHFIATGSIGEGTWQSLNNRSFLQLNIITYNRTLDVATICSKGGNDLFHDKEVKKLQPEWNLNLARIPYRVFTAASTTPSGNSLPLCTL
jgi:hypothetical protein